MKHRFRNRVLVVYTVFLLLGSGFIMISSSDGFVVDQENGVWYDPDMSHFSEIENCEVSQGGVRLEKLGAVEKEYNFSDGKKHVMTTLNSTLVISFEDSPIKIFENTLLKARDIAGETLVKGDGHKHLRDGKSVVSLNNDSYSKPTKIGNISSSPVHHFKFKIDEPVKDVTTLGFNWFSNVSRNINLSSINFYVWNYQLLWGMGLYEKLDVNRSVNSGELFVHVKINHPVNYVNNLGEIDFLVVGISNVTGRCSLSTDYVNLTVISEQGYMSSGFIVSEVVKPDSLGRWESIIWEGSFIPGVSSIKIQVLSYENGNWDVLDDNTLSGNEKGFTESPVDLTALGNLSVEHGLKIKAVLYTQSGLVTPCLNSWCVLWQLKNNSFYDNFTTPVRVDRLVGVEIKNNSIHIKNRFPGWPVYGATSDNNRNYMGAEIGNKKPSVFWSSEETISDVGGWMHSPIVFNDTLYVASTGGRIYGFNITHDNLSLGLTSDVFNMVDSAVAASDDFIVFATGMINSSNKVFALSRNNLVETWNYSFDGKICFSSAPNIADSRVFITSWNGLPWDTPAADLFSQYKQWISMGLTGLETLFALLNKTVDLSRFYELIQEGNNKLIVLGLQNGTELWNVSLPSGSFSTPAVSNGMVIAGCDNILGDSLFAFDVNTGQKMWSADVGLVGRSSPVVYDDKVFVVGHCNNLTTLKSNITVFALDKYNGDILWRHVLPENLLNLEVTPRGLGVYNYLTFTSTPAVYDNTIYVTSPMGRVYAFSVVDGVKKWEYKLDEGLDKFIGLHTCTDPVVTKKHVYVASTYGVIYSFNLKGGKKWSYDLNEVDVSLQDLLKPNFLERLLKNMSLVLSSPVISDGLLHVSVTSDLTNFSGCVITLGGYGYNNEGVVTSIPIHVPRGQWWKSFKANFTSDNGGVTFSVLDENYDVMKTVSSPAELSDISQDVIRLSARITRSNHSYDPTLNNWTVTWVPNEPPVFKNNSFMVFKGKQFKPAESTWVNTVTPKCRITCYDVKPGLNPDSAKYRIMYWSDVQNKNITSNWVKTNCTGGKGSTENETITVDLSKLYFKDDIKELKNIEISVEDMVGTRSTIVKTLKIDTVKPVAVIKNTSNFSGAYKTPVLIEAAGNDTGVVSSGLKKITLCYKMTSRDKWMNYSSYEHPPFTWEFKTGESGEYELCAVATDNAGNHEDKSAELIFIYDENPPGIKPGFKQEYRVNKNPLFNLTFQDDYQLEKIEYRLSNQGNWTLLKDDVSSKTYEAVWSLANSTWNELLEHEEYLMYFRVTDSLGNVNNTEGVLEIVKDLTVSKTSVDLSDFKTFHWEPRFTIVVKTPGGDIEKVQLFYRYSPDKKEWSTWKQYGETKESSFKWVFEPSEGDGYYEFKSRVWDKAGNVGESDPARVQISVFPTTLFVVAVTAVVLTSIAATILVYRRKKTRL